MLFTGALCGCDEAERAEKQPEAPPLVDVLLYQQDDIYLQLVTVAIAEEISGRARVGIAYAQNDQMIQNEQIDAMLGKKVAALAVNIVDPKAAFKAVDIIKKPASLWCFSTGNRTSTA